MNALPTPLPPFLLIVMLNWLDVDHEQPNAASGDQAVQRHIEAAQFYWISGYSKPLMSGTHTSSFCPPDNISVAVSTNQNFCWHDPRSAQGMPTDSGYLEDQAQSVANVHSCGDQHIEWHQVSYVEVLRRGILADGTGSHGAGVAPIPQNPITDADQLEALGTSNCPEVGVGSTLGSSVHNALSFPQGGVPRQCTNSKQLCRNLADLRQKDAASGAQVNDGTVPSLASGRDMHTEGFKLKSIPKKLKRPKQKRSPPSNHHL
ncbi:hypothetical protein Nepgr_008096 [Nepenthes gracilis]|uniref:Uncharacterized protein n=1 Tax=Nepenthes gracilis TaxID=150966 RepID=A0AAD3XJ46_NEPGR|nr:hypothetical protein Nepgr_008096 [Nepenthes gracilis]